MANQGNYEKAFEVAQQALVLSEEIHDVANKVLISHRNRQIVQEYW